MGGTTFQNVQRGTVFMFFLILVYYFVMVTIALVKKQIDPIDQESEGQAYRDKEQGSSGQNAAAPPAGNPYKVDRSQSEANFDSSAIRAEQPKEEDPPIIKVVKKTRLSELFFLPLLVIVPLNMLTGTSKAFLMVNLLVILVCLALFNIIRVHRKADEAGHKCVNVILDNLWLFLLFFMFVNQWGATPVSQPYSIV